MLAPLLFRYWYRNRNEGSALLQRIADETIRFPGIPDQDRVIILGEVSMPILNEVRHDSDEMAKLAAIWRSEMARLFGSPLARIARAVGWNWALKKVAGWVGEVLRHQPPFQPVSYQELEIAFARPASHRIAWQATLACLERPDLPPRAIADVLGRADQPFDIYLMIVCERALICRGATVDPSGLGFVEHLFHHGCRWFRHSILYSLFHIVRYLPHVEDSVLDRFDAMSEEFFTSNSWRLSTDVGHYMLAANVANADVVAAQHRPGRAPRVMPGLLRQAIQANDVEQITALFAAIDGIAVYHNNAQLALTLIEQALDFGGASLLPRAMTCLASVRLWNQPAVDKYIEQHAAFAGIDPSDIAAAAPSIAEEDLLTLMDGFIIHMLLTSEAFHSGICGAFRRACSAADAQELLVQILVWVRDELAI